MKNWTEQTAIKKVGVVAVNQRLKIIKAMPMKGLTSCSARDYLKNHCNYTIVQAQEFDKQVQALKAQEQQIKAEAKKANAVANKQQVNAKKQHDKKANKQRKNFNKAKQANA